MNQAIIILGVIVLVSLLGLLGGVLLLWKDKIAKKISHFLVSFGAGALLGITFFDLLPEALEVGDVHTTLLVVFGGFILFYIIEKAISWYHCHHHECETSAPRYLIVLGDFVHNLIDGILIAVTFMIDVRLGFITAVGVLLHELPQEIGDFGILFNTGLSRAKVIVYNLISAAGALLGGVLVLSLGSQIEGWSPWLLAIVAGNFIYIAAVDLIPATHAHDESHRKKEWIHVLTFILGAALLWWVSIMMPHQHAHEDDRGHEVIEEHVDDEHHDEEHEHDHDH